MKLYEALSETARKCIKDALEEADGNVTHAAHLLGINRTHVYRLAAIHGVPMGKKPRPVSVVQELANWRRA